MLRINNQIKSLVQYVPLQQVNIQSTIHSFAADVTITQIFRNDKYKSIETIYYFPIEEQAVIYNFTVHIDNRKILAELKEKNDIKFEDDSQHVVLEQDEKSQNNFMISIGILPPLKECIITISYVTELDLIQGSIIRFVIPRTITSRYNPQKGNFISLKNQKSKSIQFNSYRIEFQCRIEKLIGLDQQQYISQLNSPSHQIDIDLSIQDAYIVTFTQNNTYLDRDIILDIKLSDKRANTFVILESDAAMAVLTPFEEDCYIILDNKQINEFIFILDCSQSMKNENKIGLIREAMLYFLKNLPNNSYFNIIQFGAKYTCLFNQSTVFYNHLHVRIAEKFISQIRANLGGTNILAPLHWLEGHPPEPGRTRQVFLLTDGEISNVSEVLELCRSMESSTRIFSFGLGISPSRSLIKGLARRTNGRFVFIPPNTNIDIYMKEQLQKSIQRCIKNIHIKWNLGVDVENIPNQLSSAYMNDRLIIYALINNQTIPFNHKSSIEIRTDQSYYHLDITDSNRLTNNNKMIARLAAKALIIELEQVQFEHSDDYSKTNETIRSKEDIKQRIIDLSLRYNILSPYTTFIGIEQRLNDSNTNEIVRKIQTKLSSDNQYIQPSDSRIKKFVSDTKDVDLYPSKISTTQHLFSRPIPVEKSLSKSPNRKRDSLEHAQPNRDMFTPVKSSTTIQTNSSILLNQRKHHMREKESHSDQNEISPIDDKNIVHYLMNKQTIDGLWNFTSNRKTIKKLTGKSLSVFQSSEIDDNPPIIITAIIIILLEVKFMTLQSIWDNAVEKARQHIVQLLNNDWKKLVSLFRDIRIILNG